MRQLVRGLLGIAAIAVAVVVVTAQVYDLAHTQACSSPGVIYEQGSACPKAGDVLLLIGALLIPLPLGIVLYGSRTSGRGGNGLVTALAWSLLWIAAGSALWVGVNGAGAPPTEAKTGASIAAVVFWALGAGSLLLTMLVAGRARRALARQQIEGMFIRPAEQAPASITGPPTPPDVIEARLARLDALLRAGTISQAEHAAQRATILRDV